MFAAPYTVIDTQFHKRLKILNCLETIKTLRHVSDKYFKKCCIGWATSHRTVFGHATRRAHADPHWHGDFSTTSDTSA
jgi:hypothetical protein